MKQVLKVFVVMSLFALTLFAAGKDPLFTHITSDGAHRSMMAAQFSSKMLKKGHPVTIYLTDVGVKVASKKYAELKNAQSIIKEIIAQGGRVYICPMCMQQYKVEGADLIEGVKLGNADLLEKALFAPNTKTINW